LTKAPQPSRRLANLRRKPKPGLKQAQLKTRTLTPAQLREKARAEWLEFRRSGGKAADKTKGSEKARERDATDDGGKEKDRSRTRDDDDFSV
jgi:hypothetical protein